MNPPPLAGTLDFYRELAKTDENVAVLVGMIDRTSNQLRIALESLTHVAGKAGS